MPINEMGIDVCAKPTKFVEFITIQFVVTTDSISFRELMGLPTEIDYLQITKEIVDG